MSYLLSIITLLASFLIWPDTIARIDIFSYPKNVMNRSRHRILRSQQEVLPERHESEQAVEFEQEAPAAGDEGNNSDTEGDSDDDSDDEIEARNLTEEEAIAALLGAHFAQHGTRGFLQSGAVQRTHSGSH